MALSIGVRVGQVLMVGDSRVVVVNIGPGEHMKLLVGRDKVPFQVAAINRVEILPEVYVSIGKNGTSFPGPRLCFEARKDIPITRVEHAKSKPY